MIAAAVLVVLYLWWVVLGWRHRDAVLAGWGAACSTCAMGAAAGVVSGVAGLAGVAFCSLVARGVVWWGDGR